MTDFIYSKIKTEDVLTNNSGLQLLFAFGVADYIVHLQTEGKKVPETITTIGVILEEEDSAASIENFADMINHNPDCDLVIFGTNLLPKENDLTDLYRAFLHTGCMVELKNVYDDRVVFCRAGSTHEELLNQLIHVNEEATCEATKVPRDFLFPKTDETEIMNLMKQIKEICEETALGVKKIPNTIFAAQKKRK